MNTLEDVRLLAEIALDTTYEVKALGKTFKINPKKDLRYTFEFDRAKRRFGCCHYSTKKITLSKSLCEANLDKLHGQIEDTILHEIAHALCVKIYGHSGAGHDWKWKSIADQVGCEPRRCYDSNKIKKPKSKYTLICPSCGKQTPKHRDTGRVYSCGECGTTGKYEDKYKLIVKQNY